MSIAAPVERHLDYLLHEEREERNERRGLEQRAGGLIAALLVAFPVAGTVAKNANLDSGVQLAGLILLTLVLLGAVAQAWRLSAALGAPRRAPNRVREARDAVQTALSENRLTDAVEAQQTIVRTMRDDNGNTVSNVRAVTRTLPLTVLGLLVALSLIVGGGGTTTQTVAGPRGARGLLGPRGVDSQRGPRGSRGPRGLRATITPNTP